MSSIRERVSKHISQFNIGDNVEAFVDQVEIEGKIIAIQNSVAKIETKWGILTVSLSLAKKI